MWILCWRIIYIIYIAQKLYYVSYFFLTTCNWSKLKNNIFEMSNLSNGCTVQHCQQTREKQWYKPHSCLWTITFTFRRSTEHKLSLSSPNRGIHGIQIAVLKFQLSLFFKTHFLAKLFGRRPPPLFQLSFKYHWLGNV